MSYLVGYGPRNDDRSAMERAFQLARARPEPVIALSVVPRGWGTPAAAGTDREYELWAAEEGRTHFGHGTMMGVFNLAMSAGIVLDEALRQISR